MAGPYLSIFENVHGERWILSRDNAGTFHLYGEDVDWTDTSFVADDWQWQVRDELVLDEAEWLWLTACVLAATTFDNHEQGGEADATP